MPARMALLALSLRAARPGHLAAVGQPRLHQQRRMAGMEKWPALLEPMRPFLQAAQMALPALREAEMDVWEALKMAVLPEWRLRYQPHLVEFII